MVNKYFINPELWANRKIGCSWCNIPISPTTGPAALACGPVRRAIGRQSMRCVGRKSCSHLPRRGCGLHFFKIATPTNPTKATPHERNGLEKIHNRGEVGTTTDSPSGSEE